MLIVFRTMFRIYWFTHFRVRHQCVYSCARHAENHLLLWIDKIVLCVCLCLTDWWNPNLLIFFVVRVISVSLDVDCSLPTFFCLCCWLFENMVHSFANVCFQKEISRYSLRSFSILHQCMWGEWHLHCSGMLPHHMHQISTKRNRRRHVPALWCWICGAAHRD